MPIPAETREKILNADKGARDFYGDLSDEEREEEGLPPREDKPQPDPKKEPAEAEPQTPEDEEEELEEDDEPADVTELIEQIAGMREDLTAALGKPEPAAKGKEDPLIAAGRDHEDPVIQGLTARLERAEKALAAQQEERQVERHARQLAQDDKDFAAVQRSFTIDGKPLTKQHIEAVEDYILQNPEVGSRLTIPQLTRLVHPSAIERAAPPRGAKRDAEPQEGKVATIVDEGNTGGTTQEKWKPGPNDDMGTAMRAAGQRFGWRR